MNYKSNITVASNIFNRLNDDPKKDEEFVHQCRGDKFLKELKETTLYGTNTTVKLTDIQKKELSNQGSCGLAKDKQKTHGPIKQGCSIKWVCRCEYHTCDYFNICMQEPIIRKNKNIIKDPIISEPLKFEWFKDVKKNCEQHKEKFFDRIDTSEHYTQISDPESIIKSDFCSRILVNAGPGTGKTYTVIERLIYIINNSNFDLGQVLVLCYTNQAKKLIVNRLIEKGFGSHVSQLVICTVDSLAWQNLIDVDTPEQFNKLLNTSFNDRIKLFNSKFNKEEWTEFEYLIVDEIQDLVNERALMILKIIESIKCGYLLLGDKCQAIYDYDCNSKENLNSTEFYKKLISIIPKDALKYELTKNHRQSLELYNTLKDYREVMLSHDDVDINELFFEYINTIECIKFSSKFFKSESGFKSRAILTRSNGEAEWISTKLHKSNVDHTLIRNTTKQLSLHRWIADMFWDFQQPRIGKENFVQRYLIRVCDNIELANNCFDNVLELLSLKNSGQDYFELDDLIDTLIKNQDLHQDFLNNSCESLIVTTIHKAKGQEFDEVYILGDFNMSETDIEECRVWYVALTRAKTSIKKLKRLSKSFMNKPTNMGRRMAGFYTWQKFRCKEILLGTPDDIDKISFVFGDLQLAVKIQKYLHSDVKVNDQIDAIYNEGIYEIFHKGIKIGNLNKEVTTDIRSAINMTGKKSNIPSKLANAYVSNIVTVVHNFPSGANQIFKKSRVWLGIEITGFAKADWEANLIANV